MLLWIRTGLRASVERLSGFIQRRRPAPPEEKPAWYRRSYSPGNARRHVAMGQRWLIESQHGQNTAALAYAALEFRFAIEALAVRYQMVLEGGERSGLKELSSFKSVEKRIYALAGHQLQINKQFEFMRVVLEALKIPRRLITPKIGKLSKQWHACSERCHIGWVPTSEDPKVREETFQALSVIARELEENVDSLGWPDVADPDFRSIRERFMAGRATTDDVVAHIKRTGAWARETFNDGRPARFVGTPIEPD